MPRVAKRRDRLRGHAALLAHGREGRQGQSAATALVIMVLFPFTYAMAGRDEAARRPIALNVRERGVSRASSGAQAVDVEIEMAMRERSLLVQGEPDG